MKKLSKRKAGIIILAALFVITNLFLVPLLAQFPRFFAAEPMAAAGRWLEAVRAVPFGGPQMLLTDNELRRFWLYLQPVLLAGVVWLLWQPGLRRNRNRIQDGVGGPAHAEYSITHGSSRWNPLHPVAEAIKAGDPSKASAAAWDIAHMIVHQSPITGDPIWANGEESVIAAMILLSAAEAPEERFKHLGTAYTILYTLGAADEDGKLPLNDYITSLSAGHLAKAAYGTALLAPYRQRGSFFTGASADLRLFADPAIVHLTSAQDHELDLPGKEKTAVFLCIPDEKGTRHILASLYVDQTYQALVELAVRHGGRLPVMESSP